MFDIGFSELFVIAVVALLVLGPERLPRAARFAGLWMRRARAQWYSVKSELEHELAAEELRRSLRETQDDLRSAQTGLQREGAALHEEVRAATAVEPDDRADASPYAYDRAPTDDGASSLDPAPVDRLRADAPTADDKPARDER